ncbi:MAG: PKD domain-containing protein, partial [Candidatus Thermoplasmatota archaeon]|nr:PKD domain-containing protein [Candidatus Thermoplasmatota archaeon]
ASAGNRGLKEVQAGWGGDFGGPQSDPIAAFTTTCTQLACTLDGSTSSDPDGTITQYQWSLGDGDDATGTTATHTYPASGTYTITLTVTDDRGAIDTATRTLTVDDTNQAPTAAFTPTCTYLTCNLDATGSEDPEGALTGYDWALGDGATTTGETASYTYAAPGTYTVTLTVTDAEGATDTATEQVTVDTANSPPTASFTHACTDLSCDFDASSSSDPDGTIASYAWTLGDGATATGATPATHTYPTWGSYTVTLTVTDDDGATSQASAQVTVGPEDPGFVYEDADCNDRYDPGTDTDLTGSYDTTKVDLHVSGCVVVPAGIPLSPDGEVDIHANRLFVASDLTSATHRIHLAIEEGITIVGGTTLYAGGDKIDIQAKGGIITMNNVTLHSPHHEVKVKAEGYGLYAYGATIRAPEDKITIDEKTAHVDLRHASLDAGSEIAMATVDSLRADGASFVSATKSIQVWSDTLFQAENATFEAYEDVNLGANDADLELNHTEMDSATKDLKAEVKGDHWARLHGASVQDENGLLDLKPDGRYTGTLASGGVE